MTEKNNKMLLTSSGVADLLQVHASTVKRWSDEGALPSRRTDGGHRRIHLQDALDMARHREIPTFLDPFHPWEANVWLAVTDAEEARDYRRLLNLSLVWLSKGETNLLGRLLFEVGQRPGIPFFTFVDEGIRGLMARVGEEWQKGRLVVGEEHMATQVVSEVLLRLRPGWDQVGTDLPGASEPHPTAITGSMEGDHHDLGAQAIRVLLEREGWRVYHMGADVPVEEFAEVQRAQGASLVCISFSPKNALPDLQRAVRVLGEFYRPGFPYALALGGTLGQVDDGEIPTGPFKDRSISRSAEEFLGWVRTLSEDSAPHNPRRVA